MQPLADVGDLRRLTGGAWADEGAAAAMLAAASGQVRTYCGWPITTETEVTAVVDSDGSRILTIPCLRVTAVHEVTDDDNAPITDYRWSASGVLFRRARWPAGLRAVSVVYSGGYDDTPPELIGVVCGLASRLSVPAGVASWSVGSQTVTYNSEAAPGLATVEEVVLDRYRIYGS